MNYKLMLISFVGCLLLLNVNHLVEAGRDIPIRKCCHGETFFYLQGFDSCKNDSDHDSAASWPPLVYSSANLNSIEEITADDFNVTTAMEGCPEGQIAVSTTKFKFIDDGSLNLEDGPKLKQGQFCLNQVFGSSNIIARFCAPDPCIEMNSETAGCIRKCCPNGMELISKHCQPSSASSFDIEFKNKLGESVNQSLSSYVIRDGVAPKCIHGIFPLGKAFDEVFYILPDANIYIPGYPAKDRTVSDYCIETDETDTTEKIALTCFPQQPEPVTDDVRLALQIYPYILLFSSLFLIATFAVYCILPEIRSSVHGVSVMCFVASLTLFYVGMAIIQLWYEGTIRWFCIGIAIFVHFFYLSTFTWLNVLSYDIFSKFRELQNKTNNMRKKEPPVGKRLFFYSMFAWGVPLLIVITGQILQNVDELPSNIVTPGFGLKKCWFESNEALSAYLYGPMTVLIIINIVFFIMTIIMLYRNKVDTAFSARNQHAMQKFRLMFSLFLLMGVSWMMEVISFWAGGSAYIWIPTDILNICSAIFIFVMFVCLKPNVFKLLKDKYPCLKRLNPFCPSFMLEESRNVTRHQQQPNATTNFLSSEDGNNERNTPTAQNITQINE